MKMEDGIEGQNASLGIVNSCYHAVWTLSTVHVMFVVIPDKKQVR